MNLLVGKDIESWCHIKSMCPALLNEDHKVLITNMVDKFYY